MINLLPPKEKEALLLEKRGKLIIILGITIVIPLICLILILFSIRFYILADVDAQKIILEQNKKRYQTPDFLNFTNIIKTNNLTLGQLDPFYKKEIYIGNVLKTIAELPRPKNVYIKGLSLKRTDSQKVTVIISGFSQSRDDLIAFQNDLKNDGEIKNIYFSPESWIDSANVNFYLTFQI